MKKGILALVMGAFFLSSEAMALIHGQALIGQRKMNVKDSETFSGTEIKLAGYLDPIPLVPIGFGAYFSTTDFGSEGIVTDFKGNEIGLEVTAWSPVPVLGLTPYGRVGYTMMGAYETEFGTVTAKYEPSGLRLGAGLKWSPLPLMAVLFEVEQSSIELKFDEVTGAGSELITGLGTLKTDSLGILLGVEVGI